MQGALVPALGCGVSMLGSGTLTLHPKPQALSPSVEKGGLASVASAAEHDMPRSCTAVGIQGFAN